MRLFVTALLLLLLAGTVFATIPWTPEDAARAREAFDAGERVLPPPGGFRFSGDPLADYDLAASFIAGKQVTDPLDPDYGGIREAEHMMDVIQTDNTSESIWIFTRHHELTGQSTYLDNLDASWSYVLSHPAYNEEGGDDLIAGYYRIYNCGWAVRAGLKYEEVTGDTTYRPYVDSCASYLANHNLGRTGTTGFYNLVNPPVLAWGAGNLYAYGFAREDSIWKFRAWKRGNRVKNWVDGDPAILSNEEWAVSGGAVTWGILESYLRENTAEESLWVATYAPMMDTLSDPANWENAGNGWYALGWKRAERTAHGDPAWGARHLAITDYLRAFDTDDDGGIQGNPADTDTMDHAWIASYLGFMCFDPLIEEDTEVALGGGGAPVRPVVLFPNRPNPFNPATEIAFSLAEPARIRLNVYDPAGRLVARVADGDYSAGRHALLWDGRDRRGSPSPSGVYFYRLGAGRWTSTRKMVLIR